MKALQRVVRECYPSDHELFWCQDCDERQVDPNNLTTGKFYEVGGHVRKLRLNCWETGDYEHVVFAICTNCLNRE